MPNLSPETIRNLEAQADHLRGADIKRKFKALNSGPDSEMLRVVRTGRSYDIPALLSEIARIPEPTERYRLAAWVVKRDQEENRYPKGESSGPKYVKFPWSENRGSTFPGKKLPTPPQQPSKIPTPYTQAGEERRREEQKAQYAANLATSPSKPGRKPKTEAVKRPRGRPRKTKTEAAKLTLEQQARKEYQRRLHISRTWKKRGACERKELEQRLRLVKSKLLTETNALASIRKIQGDASEVAVAQQTVVQTLRDEIEAIKSRIEQLKTQAPPEVNYEVPDLEFELPPLYEHIKISLAGDVLSSTPSQKVERTRTGAIKGERKIPRQTYHGEVLHDLRDILEAYTQANRPQTTCYLATHFGVVREISNLYNVTNWFKDFLACEKRVVSLFCDGWLRSPPDRYYVKDHEQLKEGFYYLLPWAEEFGIGTDPDMFESKVKYRAWYIFKTRYSGPKFTQSVAGRQRELAIMANTPTQYNSPRYVTMKAELEDDLRQRDYWRTKRDEEASLAAIDIEDLL
jgi:hypothetical protein